MTLRTLFSRTLFSRAVFSRAVFSRAIFFRVWFFRTLFSKTLFLRVGAASLLLGQATLIQTLLVNTASAQEFGIIMDYTDIPSLSRNGASSPVEVGTELMIGDALNLSADGQVVFVEYKTCEETTLFGAGRATIISDKNIHTARGQKRQLRQLPVCYEPELFADSGLSRLGGMIMMTRPNASKKAPTWPTAIGKAPAWPTAIEKAPTWLTAIEIERMRRAAERARISNSELVSLIVYELQNNNRGMAKSYHAQFMAKNPNAVLPPQLLKQLR